MKILVGNHKLEQVGGSETYTYTMILELLRKGHEVECITTGRAGVVSDKIKELGIPVYFNEHLTGTYDLALLSHTSIIKLTSDVKAFKVQTCHGIYPLLEQPMAGMNAYVAISEEVQQHLESKGFPSVIIRNGIDCERFKPAIRLHDRLQVVLSLSHSEAVNRLLKRVCGQQGLCLITCEKYNDPKWNIEDWINMADLVVSLGRGAYEAMAAGRNVLILDNRAYAKQGAIGDGMITSKNIIQSLKHNCSGRACKKKFTAQDVADAFAEYSEDTGIFLRLFAEVELNIEFQVQKYLSLCSQ